MNLLNKEGEKVLTVSSLSEKAVLSAYKKPNFYGIFLFTEAKGFASIDHQQIKIKANSILFYYPYQKFILSGKFEGEFLQFHPDFFCIDIHAKDIGCQGLLFNNFFSDLILQCDKNEFKNLSKLISALKEELEKKEIGQLDMISSQLKIFLINAVRCKLEKQSRTELVKENLHVLIEKLIEQHFTKESSPDFYANELGISLSKFNRLCHKYFQNSFITIVNLKKISKAKNRLFLTNFTVKEIAYDLGFNDPLYFTRVFKKLSGISPTEFRKQLKNNKLI